MFKAVRTVISRSCSGAIWCRLIGAAAICAPCAGAQGEQAYATTSQLKQLSIDELMTQEVITVSRRPERLQDVASGLVVITSEDILRAGATQLPHALRQAPNLQVAQSDGRNWAITARGSNNTTANKLLVMVDGRTVYTPLFAGVFWDSQGVYLPDVDRIEVVSGPGGTSWGTNAVNGVINVVSKRAQDTQGAHVYAAAGTEERLAGGVRYGGRLGETGYYRVYAKGFDVDSTITGAGEELADAWRFKQGGFRVDLEPAAADRLSLHGDLYEGRGRPPTGAPVTFSGGNVVLDWQRAFSSGSELQVKTYLDESKRVIPSSFNQRLRIYDVDVQYRFEGLARHIMVVGAGYRYGQDETKLQPALAFLPLETSFDQYNVFVQDEWAVLDDRLRLTAGVKLEHNDFGGNEWQPSVRGAFALTEHQTIWGAVSRAARAPSRIDRDFYVPSAPPFLLGGGPNFRSEKLWAYELGYRARLSPNASVSATAFHHEYYSLRTLEPGTPSVISNGANAKLTGVEVTLDYRISPTVRWRLGYLAQDRDVSLKPWSRDLNQGMAEASDPKQQILLGWSWDLGDRVTLDGQWRYVDELPTIQSNLGNLALPPVVGTVPAYQELDLRLAYRLAPGWEAAVIGRSLLHPQHVEFGASARRANIQRSVSVTLTWSR